MRFASQQIAQQNSESLPESRAKRKFPVSEYKYYNPANRTKNVLLRKTVHFFVQEKNCSRNIQRGGPFCYILPSFAKCSHRKTKHREKNHSSTNKNPARAFFTTFFGQSRGKEYANLATTIPPPGNSNPNSFLRRSVQ